MQAKLTVVGGKANKGEVVLQLPATIGRSRDADLTVGHRMISRKHCEAHLVDGLVMIRDAGSLNGTYVHGRRIREAPLPPGEKFSIGPITFRIDYEYSGDRSKLPPIIPADSAPTEVTPGKPADAESTRPTPEPVKQPANSRPKKAEVVKPEPAKPSANDRPKKAEAAKPELAPAPAKSDEEPDFELADDDFELAVEQPAPEEPKPEPPKKKVEAQKPAVQKPAAQKPAAPKPAIQKAKPEKDPEDQLLDDFLNDLQ